MDLVRPEGCGDHEPTSHHDRSLLSHDDVVLVRRRYLPGDHGPDFLPDRFEVHAVNSFEPPDKRMVGDDDIGLFDLGRLKGLGERRELVPNLLLAALKSAMSAPEVLLRPN